MSISKVAVLIPTYKPQEYIVRCFQSLDSQTLDKSRFKVYVALNGSDKAHAQYLEKLLKTFDFRYEMFVLEPAGVSRARNFLIENSLEEYLVFIDDDDFVSDNYLKGLLEVASVDCMAVSNIKTFSSDLGSFKNSYRDYLYHSFDNNEVRHWKSRKHFSSQWAKMLHRSIIAEFRQDINLGVGEDSFFMAEISKNIRYTRKTGLSDFYVRNERPQSASTKRVNRLEELNRIFYLLSRYTTLLFKPQYQKAFVLSRMAATIMHLKRLF